MAFLTDLFVNFTQFSNGTNDSLEAKFIKWKRFYDASSYPLNITNPTQQDLLEYINTDTQEISQTFPIVDVLQQTDQRCDYQITLSSPPPPPPVPPQTPTSPPLELVDNNYQLPNDLITIQNSADCYRNFTLENLNKQQVATKTMPKHIEIIATSSPPPQSKGKNIAQLKEIYKQKNETPEQEEETPKRKKKETPKPRPRKRKHVPPPSCETTETVEIETKPSPPIGPGRPTKNDALAREEANSDCDSTQMTIREVKLLSHDGTVRKKTKILTKYPNNIKCFAIKHYTSYEYVANKRKKYRNTLKALQYIETNLEPYIKDMSNF